mmetsp:Transcript_12365/g.33929  ORF Transcript_12365/g.33929 Transcript_12365/m.33929 type:complete len:320 (-) Transcript_12365:274-1233(-)
MGPATVHAVRSARHARTVHVVVGLHVEGLAPDDKSQLGEAALLGAIDLSAVAKVQEGDQRVEVRLRPHHQRAAGVEHALAGPLAVLLAEAHRLPIDGEVRELELPVALLRDVHPAQPRGHARLRVVAKGDLGLVLDAPPQVHGEDGPMQWGSRVARQDAKDVELLCVREGLTKAQDTVPLRVLEGVVRLLRHRDKVRVRARLAQANAVARVLPHAIAHREVDDLGVPVGVRLRALPGLVRPSNGDHGAALVLPEAPVLRARGAVALGRRHEEVPAASVKDHSEGLRRRANGDLAVVLQGVQALRLRPHPVQGLLARLRA